MQRKKLLLTLCGLLIVVLCCAQKKSAHISGRVVDEDEKPLAKVSVTILGRQNGIATSDSGTFRIMVPAEKAIALSFTSSGFRDEQRNFYLSENEEETIVVRMEHSSRTLEEVVIVNRKDREEMGLVRVNPKNALIIPSATGGVESLLKIFVGSNNELTSQYSVRGGNYDENLVYLNDFEIFRPYLVRSGQQEGLSLIDPELTGRISFYNGGFQAKYGDKMSSVLDIQYKKPKQFGGSAYISLLEQGFHLEGSSRGGRFSYLLGLRQRTDRNLLTSQETKGSYVPTSTGIQALFTYDMNERWQWELLGLFSQTKFTLIPEEAQLTSSVFSPLFSANLGLDIFFEGREEDRYSSNMLGISATNLINKNIRLKWMLSRLDDDEKEYYDISGAYLFGECDFDRSKPTFGLIVNPLGAGVFMNHARNKLGITDWNFSHKGSWETGKHFVQWGLTAEKTLVNDYLNEWEAQDSAGYNLPYDPNQFRLSKVLKSSADLDIDKFSGYLQDNISIGKASNFTLQGVVRFNYNFLNKEFLLSPRAQLSWAPGWKKDIVLKLAAGLYDQPPFYRELRRYDGSLNTDVKAQKSWQLAGGLDYNFKAWNRPFRFTSEAYYKRLWDVDPYDIDNVRIRYFGENNAKAYATGLELRLFGELVKDAESWISLGLMRARENIDNDFYFRYKNAEGEFINAASADQAVTDSVRTEVGWVRRPTDRLITFGMFFQDYLSTNKNFKVHLNMIYGSNMPYNIPGSIKYRNALVIEPYLRVDIGFSALLLDSEKSNRRSHSPFRAFDNIWASLEVFNLLDRANTISYLLIKDYSNTIFTIPNRLTPRLLNFKILARF